MPYCNKCGAFIPETDEFAGICENCSDISSSHRFIAQRRLIGRPSFDVIRNHSIR